jgi:ubiquinone/menaquinone biosynthesis C-methylase UbiE
MSSKRKMQNLSFKMMAWTFKVIDLIHNPHNKLEEFNIVKGDVVVDYGCGPGRYLQKAAELVGTEGKVYAVDVHPLAIDYVNEKIRKHKLDNVTPYLVENGTTQIESDSADIIYALDMFHAVDEPETFFRELDRISKKDGTLYLEDGHQSRQVSREKIALSNLWNIEEEIDNFLILTPGINK